MQFLGIFGEFTNFLLNLPTFGDTSNHFVKFTIIGEVSNFYDFLANLRNYEFRRIDDFFAEFSIFSEFTNIFVELTHFFVNFCRDRRLRASFRIIVSRLFPHLFETNSPGLVLDHFYF